MAFEHATASDNFDLLDRVRRLAVAQGWTQIVWKPRRILLPIRNPSADTQNLEGWTITSGTPSINRGYYNGDGFNGRNYFTMNGERIACTMEQKIAIPDTFHDAIDDVENQTLRTLNVSWRQNSATGVRLEVSFFDENDAALGTPYTGAAQMNTGWAIISHICDIPALARHVKIRLHVPQGQSANLDTITLAVGAREGYVGVDTSELVLRSPRQTSTFHIQIRALSEGGRYYFRCRLLPFYDSNLKDDGQPNISGACYTLLWNNAMPYWLSINKRRILLSAHVSTTYHSLYAGLFLPFAPSDQYPLPLYLAGDSTSPGIWHQTGASIVSGRQGYKAFHLNNGRWPTSFFIWPWQTFQSRRHSPSESGLAYSMGRTIDGSYPLFPATLISRVPLSTQGVLDGVYYTPGIDLAPQQRITEGTTNYRAFPDFTRQGRGNYWAMKEV